MKKPTLIIKRVLKHNRIAYRAYRILFSNLLRFIGLFIRLQDNLILISSYGGKRYDDSPRVIHEYLRRHQYLEKFRVVWALAQPENINIPCADTVRIDSLKFFLVALRAKYWITNSSMERGLFFKKRDTICLNTWHGTPIKKMGSDIPPDSKFFRADFQADIMLAQSGYEAEIFSRAFRFPLSKIRITGLPRNDELCGADGKRGAEIRTKIGLLTEKRIILYAPTFREFELSFLGCDFFPPMDFKRWDKSLGGEYVLLFRAHYEVQEHIKFGNNEFVHDVSEYPNLNELMIVSDVLVSDYSSIFFDYSILERPMFCFAYDYKQYIEKRGMYIDLESELPNKPMRSEEEVIEAVLNMDYECECRKTRLFKDKYIQACGDAASKAVSLLLSSKRFHQ